MRNAPLLAIIGLLFFGLGFSHGRIIAPVPSPSPAVPSAAATPTFASPTPVIQLGLVTGASPAEAQMIQQGAALVNSVMATPCFKAQVLASAYTENLGLTPAQIWARLVSKPILVGVDMYMGTFAANHFAKTIGYESVPHDGIVHMNRYFVGTAYMVADNLAHEGEGHSQGFDHLYVKATSEPYGMNAAFEACAK